MSTPMLSRPRPARHERGQATAEYALVLLGAATVALLLVAWATETGAVRLMLRGAAVLTAAGLLLGAALSVAAARALRHLLHGVSPLDLASFSVACLLVAAVSLLACYIPARRAATISPVELLRN